MDKITILFKQKGYTVTDTSKAESYDLFCKKDGVPSRRVEIKSTIETGDIVNVTRTEVEVARESSVEPYDLVVVHSIEVEETDGEYITKNGQINIIENWYPEDENLTVISYRYRLPAKHLKVKDLQKF